MFAEPVQDRRDGTAGAGGGWWTGVPVRVVVAAVALVLLAVSGLFGGLREVDDAGLPAVPLDRVHPGEPWNVAVTGGRVLDALPPLTPERAGNGWFVVLATVEVTAMESRNDIRRALGVPGVPGLSGGSADHVMLMRDATHLDYLGPGLPEQLAFVWEHAAGAVVPSEVEVEVYGLSRRVDTLSGRLTWLDPRPTAVVRVPVLDRREGPDGA